MLNFNSKEIKSQSSEGYIPSRILSFTRDSLGSSVSDKSVDHQEILDSLYTLFSQFEDKSFIEILVKQQSNNQDPEFKFYFPRYQLELNAYYDKKNKAWCISPSTNADLVLKMDQTSPLPHFKSALIFENRQNKEEVAIVPYQEFYVPEEKKTSSKTKVTRTIYHEFSFDTKNAIKKKLIGEDEPDNLTKNREQIEDLKTERVPEGPWHYANSEQYFTLAIDKNTQKFKSQEPIEALYLCYLHLNELEADKALSYLKDIMDWGGIKGDPKELDLIEKIINGVPRFPNDAKIENPSYLAVKSHAFSLLTHYMAQGNSLPYPDPQLKMGTKTEFYFKKKSEELMKFYKEMNVNLRTLLGEYHDTQQNIPSYLRLEPAQEYEMLKFLHYQHKGDLGSLSARYKQLKAKYFAKELSHVKDVSKSEVASLRQKMLEAKLAKEKTIIGSEFKVEKTIVTIPTGKFQNFSEELPELSAIYQEIASPTSSIVLPNIAMTDKDFLQNMAHYYKLAMSSLSKDHENKEKLKDFLMKTVVAHCQAEDEQISLIPAFSAVLLKVMKKPENFTDLKFPDDSEEAKTFITNLYNFAEAIPLVVPIEKIVEEPISMAYQAPASYLAVPPVDRIIGNTFSYPKLDKTNFWKEAKLSAFITAYQEKRGQLESSIQELIAQYPSDQPFEEVSAKIREIDHRIGQMRNDFNQTIHELAEAHFQSKPIQAQIKQQAEQFLTDVKKSQPQLEGDTLSLANRGPKAQIDKLKFDLQKSGQVRKTLEWPDLHRLYVLADRNEYREMTGLDNDDINQLHQNIADHLYLATLAKDYQSIVTSLGADDRVSLAKKLCGENTVDFATEPEMNLFQKESGFFINPRQKFYLNQLLNRDAKTDKFSNEIIQLIMGGGKSKVISPLAALKKANGTNLVIHQVKSSLFRSNYADLSSTSRALFHQAAIPFEFSRNSPATSEDLKVIYDTLHKAMVDKNYLVTTAESLQSLELKYLELLTFHSSDRNEMEIKEWKRQIKWLDKSLKLIKFQGDRIIDEIHHELDPKRRLNYTIDSPLNIPREDIRLELDLYCFFEKVDISECIHSENKNLLDVVKNNKLVQDPKDWDPILVKLATDVVNLPSSPIAQIIAKLNLTEDKKKSLTNYLLNRSDDIIENFDGLSVREKDEIAFIKTQISSVLSFTLTKNLYEHYGPTRRKQTSALQTQLAIPYSANNTPNERSRFGHYMESMNYTIQMGMQTELSDTIVWMAIEDYLRQAEAEILESPELDYENTLTNIRFKELTGFDIALFSKAKKEALQTEIETLKQSTEFKRQCLSNYIIPQIKIEPRVLSSNSANLVSMTNTTQGMSGTPWNFRAMHQDLTFKVEDGLGTDGETIDLLVRQDPKIQLQSNFNMEQFIENSCAEADQENLRAIIDVGSLYRGLSNLQIATEIANYCNQKAQLKDKIKFVMYYDNDEQVLYALNAQTKRIVKLNTTDENEISRILKCDPSERFTYYDQARATGTDLVQFEKAHAIVTFSENTLFSDLVQGIKRMRQISDKQTVMLVGPDYLGNVLDGSPNLDELLKFVSDNQDREALKMHLRGALENFHNVIRENLLQKIYAIDDSQQTSSKKAELLTVFQEVFTYQYKPDHFNNSGHISSMQETESYLETLEKDYLEYWKDLMQKAKLPVDSDEQQSIADALNKVKSQGKRTCSQFSEQIVKQQKTKQNIVQGSNAQQAFESQVEIQSQVETQLENALENETELQLEQVQQFEDKYLFSPKTEKFTLNHGTADAPGYLSSLNSALESTNFVPNFSFSPEIHMTDLFSRTMQSQRGVLGVYSKPVLSILMVASKSTSDCHAIILTEPEADYFIRLTDLEREKQFPDYHIWCVSPKETLLGGRLPEKLPTNYHDMIEQIRYFNGDCKLLSEQKTPLNWLNIQVDEKLDFLVKSILALHPHQIEHYKKLQARLSISEKILRYMMQNPGEAQQRDWNHLFPGYDKLSAAKKQSIEQFAEAIKKIKEAEDKGSFFKFRESEQFENWVSQFSDRIVPLIRAHVDSLEIKLNVIKAVENKEAISTILRDKPNFLNLNFTYPDGRRLLGVLIENERLEDIDCMLQHKVNLNATDKDGRSVFDYLLALVDKNWELGFDLIKKFTEHHLQWEPAFTGELLRMAILNGEQSPVEWLLKYHALNDESWGFLLPIITELREDAPEALKELLADASLKRMKNTHRLCQEIEKMVVVNKKLPAELFTSEPYSALTAEDIRRYKTNEGCALLTLTVLHYHASALNVLCKHFQLDPTETDDYGKNPLDIMLTPDYYQIGMEKFRGKVVNSGFEKCIPELISKIPSDKLPDDKSHLLYTINYPYVNEYFPDVKVYRSVLQLCAYSCDAESGRDAFSKIVAKTEDCSILESAFMDGLWSVVPFGSDDTSDKSDAVWVLNVLFEKLKSIEEENATIKMGNLIVEFPQLKDSIEILVRHDNLKHIIHSMAYHNANELDIEVLKQLFESGVDLFYGDKTLGIVLMNAFITQSLVDDLDPYAKQISTFVTSKNNMSQTPLHILCLNHADSDLNDTFSSVVDCMIKHGAQVDAKDAQGNTALHYLVRSVGSENVGLYAKFKALLSAGADVDIKNNHGESVRELIEKTDDATLKDLIKNSQSSRARLR